MHRQQSKTADAGSPELKSGEREDAIRRESPHATVIYEAVRREGEEELKRPFQALAWSAVAAGLSMGFSLVAEGLLMTMIPDAPWCPLVTKFGYSFGFLIVILGRQQLFTENTLTPILPLLNNYKTSVLLQVLRLWAIVLVGNMIGTFIFAAVIGKTDVFGSDVHRSFLAIGQEMMSGSLFVKLLRGIFAGWLIALMVWLLPFAETGRISVIILLTYLVGMGGFNHIIVGSVNGFYMVVTGALPLAKFVWEFWMPTFLGNILGGVLLVAVMNHAQVAPGRG